jgi:hypothetical protein
MIVRYIIGYGQHSIHRVNRKFSILLCHPSKPIFWPVSWTSLTIATIVCQAISLLPTKCHLKATFNRLVLSIDATITPFFLTISYSIGKKCLKAIFPCQASSQNLTWEPSPILNLPNLIKSDLTFISPLNNRLGVFFRLSIRSRTHM